MVRDEGAGRQQWVASLEADSDLAVGPIMTGLE